MSYGGDRLKRVRVVETGEEAAWCQLWSAA
jgi:hypothetical protein